MDWRGSCIRSRPHRVAATDSRQSERVVRGSGQRARLLRAHARRRAGPVDFRDRCGWSRECRPCGCSRSARCGCELATRRPQRSHVQPDCRRHLRLHRGTRRRSTRRTSQLRRAAASNDDAHEQQRQAARIGSGALQQASHAGHSQPVVVPPRHALGRSLGVDALDGDAARSLEDRDDCLGIGWRCRADSRCRGRRVSALGSGGRCAGNGVARQRSRGRNGRHRTRRNRQRVRGLRSASTP